MLRCTEARALEYAGVPDMSTEDAWKMVIKASKERDIDDFKLVSLLPRFSQASYLTRP